MLTPSEDTCFGVFLLLPSDSFGIGLCLFVLRAFSLADFSHVWACLTLAPVPHVVS